MTSLFSPSTGSLIQAKTWARRQSSSRLADVDAYLEQLDTLCSNYGLNFAALAAQSAHETANWTSHWWRTDLNPAGIGIMDGGNNQKLSYQNGRDAARAHVYHMLLYTIGTPERGSVAAGWRNLDPRASAVESSKIFKKARTVKDLAGTWASDKNYAIEIQNKMVDIFTAQGVATVNLPIYREIISSGRNFPNQKLSHDKLWITVHETANRNPGANARMHKNFVVGGGGTYNVSFHFAVDDKEAWQMMRLDEVAWHASDGCNNKQTDVGCFGSIAIETCVNSDSNWQKTVENLIELIAAIIMGNNRLDYGTANGSRFSADRIGTHNKWADDKKWCPTNILNQNLMPFIVAGVRQKVSGIPPKEIYEKPSRPAFMENPEELEKAIDREMSGTTLYACKRRYTAAKDTPRLKHTGQDSPKVGPDIKKGETFAGEFVYQSNGKWWVLTAFGTRIRMEDLTPKVEFKS